MSLRAENYITIIYPPTANWDLMFQRPQQLFTAFSKIKGVRSLFITLELYKPLPAPIVQVNENLYVIREGVSYEHLIKGKKVLWFSYPPQINLVEKEKFDLVVFDAIDNPVDEFSHWSHSLNLAAKKADLISCTAQVMYDYHLQFNKPMLMLPNGADYEHFEQAKDKLPCPSDFPQFSKQETILGFYGSMASWVDFELIQEIADNYKVILIGNHRFLAQALFHPNITLLEHKNYCDLPAYLSQFDLAIIPFKITEMTKGCDPIKFYEYMAAGKPTLTTALPELDKYKDYTYIIEKNNCQSVIERALAEDNQQKKQARMEIAKANSWNNRAHQAVSSIAVYLNLSRH